MKGKERERKVTEERQKKNIDEYSSANIWSLLKWLAPSPRRIRFDDRPGVWPWYNLAAVGVKHRFLPHQSHPHSLPSSEWDVHLSLPHVLRTTPSCTALVVGHHSVCPSSQALGAGFMWGIENKSLFPRAIRLLSAVWTVDLPLEPDD